MECTKRKLKYIDYNLEPVVRAYYGYNILDEFANVLNQYKYDKVFFISEEGIYNLHGKDFVDYLNAQGIQNEVIIITSSEKEKTFKNVDFLCNYLIKQKISKDSIVISFGGGVVGNISGLVAGLIYRGVPYIEIPTTFMGLTDSSLSNKQAVNGDLGKNQIGRYYAPLFIWSDIKYIETENVRNTKSAIVEGVKNTLIQDKDLLKELTEFIYQKDKFDKDDLCYLFETITQSKNRILAVDPSEKAYCVILEYGHTFGHAIEFLTNGRIIHGEAVAIGMCIAAEISKVLRKISDEDVELHYKIFGDLIFRNNKNIDLVAELSIEQILQAIQNDNKRTSDGIKYVILDEIGKCSEEDGYYQIQVPKDIVMSCMEKAFSRIHTSDEQEKFEIALQKYEDMKLDSVDAILEHYFGSSINKELFKNAFISHKGIYLGDYNCENSAMKFKLYLDKISGTIVDNVEYGPTYISPKFYGTPGWWYSFNLKEKNCDIELFTCRDFGEWSTYNQEKKQTLMSHYAIGVKTLDEFYNIYEEIKQIDSYEILVLTENDVVGHTYAHFKNRTTEEVLEVIYNQR